VEKTSILLIVLVLTLLLALSALTLAQDSASSTVEVHAFESATLERAYNYTIYLPAGYTESEQHYPVIYLLHGRGDNMDAWLNIRSTLDSMIAEGELPPLIAVMPDVPSSSRGSYYVDSLLQSILKRPEPVETAFMNDLIPHIDAAYRTISERGGRAVGGYSMGGYGAIRYALAYPDKFMGALVLSPAVYTPLPPRDSSAREFGAFGVDSQLFDEERYQQLNYPALTPSFVQAELPLYMFIAVGDDEWRHPDPEDYLHDLDMEAHFLFNHVSRVRNIYPEFRVYNGGHDWDVWQRGFAEGARYIFGFMQRDTAGGDAPDLPMRSSLTGTGGADLAGGLAVLDDGGFYQALAVEGALNGQTAYGGLDIALVRYAADGIKMWTRQFGTNTTERPYGVVSASDGGALLAGYTRGNLDGAHAGNAADDAFVMRLTPDGEPRWTIQFGDAIEADRGYGIAIDTEDNSYITGYTRGALAGENAGDKDIILAKLSPEGEILWTRQFGGEGEDKGYRVTIDAEGTIYVAGVTGSALNEVQGGLDAFLAAFDGRGEHLWTRQFGSPQWDEAADLTLTADGSIAVVGFTAGDFGGRLVGDKDLFLAVFGPDGSLLSADQLGTPLNDKAAAVELAPDGGLYVVGFTDGRLVESSGGFDILLVKYAPDYSRAWVQQFGSAEDDGADEWAESNLLLALNGDTVIISGLTLGAFGGDTPAGSTDVFLVQIDIRGD
jgi:enterochelin esterase-like enzyme